MDKYQSPIGLPDEYFRLIGIIAAHWERVEYLLELAVADVDEHDYAAVALLTSNIGFRSKLDLILCSARVLQPDFQEHWKEITAAVDAIKSAYALRNTYVHAKWSAPGLDALLPQRNVIRTAGGIMNVGSFDTTLAELEDAAAKIYQAGKGFTIVLQKHGMLQMIPASKA